MDYIRWRPVSRIFRCYSLAYRVFEPFGTILDCSIIRDRRTHLSKGGFYTLTVPVHYSHHNVCRATYILKYAIKNDLKIYLGGILENAALRILSFVGTGCGFVRFASLRAARCCIATLNQRHILDKVSNISYYRSPPLEHLSQLSRPLGLPLRSPSVLQWT